MWPLALWKIIPGHRGLTRTIYCKVIPLLRLLWLIEE